MSLVRSFRPALHANITMANALMFKGARRELCLLRGWQISAQRVMQLQQSRICRQAF